MLKITGSIQIPLREFEFTFARSSGPGGQNVNKVNTKATLAWNLEKTQSINESIKKRFRSSFSKRINKEGKVLIHSQRFRDQGRNVADCLTKIQELVRSVVKPPTIRKKTKRSRASIQRRLDCKKANSQKKEGRRQVRRQD
ncbi:MAG: alternative ribosome rescue aminoacyl-tRNA hydrolase ArfB [Planctomycetota bacterium]|nr:alternative ribosome rescue aminoacyl-tRNA hydrolase ArfB [Planctomycetota bacterium]